MDDFEQPQAPKLRDEDVLRPDDVTPTEEVLSHLDTEIPPPPETPQSPAPEPLLARNKSKKKVGLIVSAVVLMLALVGGVMWFVPANNTSQSSTDRDVVGQPSESENKDDYENPADELEPKDEIIELSVDDELVQKLFNEFSSVAAPWSGQIAFYAQALDKNLNRQLVMNIAFLNVEEANGYTAARCKGNYMSAVNGYQRTATSCYSGEEMRQEIVKLFGFDYMFTENDKIVITQPCSWDYNITNDEFYEFDAGCGGVPLSGLVRELYKAERDAARIYLYEMATYWSEESSSCGTKAVCRLGYGGWNVKIDGLMSETIKQLEKLSEYPRANEIFDKFKWTFIWNGENYVFEKLERV